MVVGQVMRRLEGCKRAIKESPWAGLAELTNKNGELCRDSVCTIFFVEFLFSWSEVEEVVGRFLLEEC